MDQDLNNTLGNIKNELILEKRIYKVKLTRRPTV
jgi:hypothetical protein